MNQRSTILTSGILFLSLGTFSAAEESTDPLSPGKVIEVTKELHDRFKHKNDFYKKAVNAGGIWIFSSEKVDDRALLEARFLILSMLKARPDVLRAIVAKNIRIGVMAHDEFTNDIPEHSMLSDWWNKRARGLGGNPVTCGEENVLNFEGDKYTGESILMHEFAHAIHHSGLTQVDDKFEEKLKTAYRNAKATGLFEGYAMGTYGEFWAESSQSWFECNRNELMLRRDKEGKRRPLKNRADLKEYLPELAKLLAEGYGDNPWLYTRMDTRMQMPHLKGYDHGKAPKFVWPQKVLDAYKAAEDKKAARRK